MGDKTYKNISPVDQLDIEPGQTGVRDIPEEQEHRMVSRGAIEVVSEGESSEQSAPETPDETPAKTPEEIEAEKAATEKAEAEAKAAAGRRGRS